MRRCTQFILLNHVSVWRWWYRRKKNLVHNNIVTLASDSCSSYSYRFTDLQAHWRDLRAAENAFNDTSVWLCCRMFGRKCKGKSLSPHNINEQYERYLTSQGVLWNVCNHIKQLHVRSHVQINGATSIIEQIPVQLIKFLCLCCMLPLTSLPNTTFFKMLYAYNKISPCTSYTWQQIFSRNPALCK